MIVDLPRPRDELATKADPGFLEYHRTVYDAVVHPDPAVTDGESADRPVLLDQPLI